MGGVSYLVRRERGVARSLQLVMHIAAGALLAAGALAGMLGLV